MGLEKFVFKSFMSEVFGFMCILLANLTYHEIMEWKFFGLDENVARNREIRISLELPGNLSDRGEGPTSPSPYGRRTGPIGKRKWSSGVFEDSPCRHQETETERELMMKFLT
jgi:hypothetical protein